MGAHFRVQVEGDHLKKLSTARPILALAELIWNAVDADATRVDVIFDGDGLKSRSISIQDNGHGFATSEAELLFGRLGGSWKAQKRTSKTKGRFLHGKEGKGRFKALALGRVADWHIRHKDGDQLNGYKLSIIRDSIVDVRISESKKLDNKFGAGVDLVISELDRDFRSLKPEASLEQLSEVFALYLKEYRDVEVYIAGEKLDPQNLVKHSYRLSLNPIDVDGQVYTAEIEIIEWLTEVERSFFYCSENGFPFARIAPRFHTPGVSFTAYLKSTYISLLQEQGLLDFADHNPVLQTFYDQASFVIKEYFKIKDSFVARADIDRWKSEKIYPYLAEPRDTVEKAERAVFDIVALNVNKHLDDFELQSRQSKLFQFRMLKQAIEKGSDELQHIMTEVLDLPEKTQKELSRLLQEADLANIITSSRLVADRLKFVNGLDFLIFDPETKALLKERSQLHRMIADKNTWIFGEEFNLTVDDQSLTEVLKKHKKLIGEDIVIDRPVKTIDGKIGIVDLMLSRSVPQNHSNEREHLIVELKRPSVKIGPDELAQIQRYAFTIAEDERFAHLKTRWSFWLISNDLSPFAKKAARQQNNPPGLIYRADTGNIQIWAKSWAEIISECRSRLEFVQEQLKAKVDRDSSLKYLRQTYDRYLGDEVELDELASSAAGDQSESTI